MRKWSRYRLRTLVVFTCLAPALLGGMVPALYLAYHDYQQYKTDRRKAEFQRKLELFDKVVREQRGGLLEFRRPEDEAHSNPPNTASEGLTLAATPND